MVLSSLIKESRQPRAATQRDVGYGSHEISYDHERLGRLVLICPNPERFPKAGDIYEATRLFVLAGNFAYNIGDRFEVLDYTRRKCGHNRHSSIVNLLIRDRLTTDIWTEFSAGVATGLFRLVGEH